MHPMMMTKAAAHAPSLEYKFTKFEATALDEKTGQFTGYASTFGNEDQGGDIVLKGAFAQTLANRDARQVKMLYEHNCYEPIGYWTDLKEDDRGLVATGQLMIDALPKAREVHAMLKARVLDSLSIGYRVLQADNDRASPHIRLLKSIDLKEISVVMFPMNENAGIETVKSSIDGSPLDIREFERWLTRDAGLTRSKSLQVISRLKSLLPSTRDAAGEVASNEPPDAAAMLALATELQRLSEAHR